MGRGARGRYSSAWLSLPSSLPPPSPTLRVAPFTFLHTARTNAFLCRFSFYLGLFRLRLLAQHQQQLCRMQIHLVDYPSYVTPYLLTLTHSLSLSRSAHCRPLPNLEFTDLAWLSPHAIHTALLSHAACSKKKIRYLAACKKYYKKKEATTATANNNIL